MNTYTSALQDMVRSFVDSGDAFEPTEVRARFMAEHADLVQEQFQLLGNKQILTQIKSFLREWSEDDGTDSDQMTLPGMSLPTAIAIPAENESGYLYRSTLSATYDDLRAALAIRDRNVQRAQARFDQLRESIEILRPEMEYDRTITVREAIDRLMTNKAA